MFCLKTIGRNRGYYEHLRLDVYEIDRLLIEEFNRVAGIDDKDQTPFASRNKN